MLLSALAWSGFVMGLAGGPHCVAMCGAACGAMGRSGPAVVHGPGERASGIGGRDVLFQVGRLVGYGVAGALAAWAVESLAWLSAQTAVLRPVWTFFHVLVLLWGAVLLITARQPLWVTGAARGIWQRIRPLTSRGTGVLAAGMLWSLMPCGLLYSALLVAGLSGGVAQGAAYMVLFALGSSVSLLLGPWLWRVMRQRFNDWRDDWGTRIAGLLLCALGGSALWMDMSQRIADWCR